MATINFLDYVCTQSIENVLNSAEGDVIVFSSYGGELDPGYAMYDSISSKKQKTIAVGCVASAAAVAFAGGVERIATKNTTFVLHNPMSISEGTADDMQVMVDILRVEQEKLLNFWASILTIPRDEVKALLDADIKIDSVKALAIGLIHQIVDNIQNNMSKHILKNALTRLGISFDQKPVIKNSLSITASDGIEYTMPDINTPEEIKAGVAVKGPDGKPYSGQLILQSGQTIECQDGVIVGIETQQSSEEEAMMNAIVENSIAQKEEIETLKAEVTNLRKGESETIVNLRKSITDKDAEIQRIKNELKKFFPDDKQKIEEPGAAAPTYSYDPKTNRYTWKQ